MDVVVELSVQAVAALVVAGGAVLTLIRYTGQHREVRAVLAARDFRGGPACTRCFGLLAVRVTDAAGLTKYAVRGLQSRDSPRDRRRTLFRDPPSEMRTPGMSRKTPFCAAG